MSLQTPVFAMLIANMLDAEPGVFDRYWSPVDSATAVFLTCKTLRHLRAAWHRANSCLLCPSATVTAQDSLLTHLATNKLRLHAQPTAKDVTLCSASLRAQFGEKSALAIALTERADGLLNWLRVAEHWLRTNAPGESTLSLHVNSSVQSPCEAMVELQNNSVGGHRGLGAAVRMFLPHHHVLLSPASSASLAFHLHHDVCQKVVDFVRCWHAESSCRALVFAFDRCDNDDDDKEKKCMQRLSSFQVFNARMHCKVKCSDF